MNLLRVESIKSSFRRRLDRKLKTDRKRHEKFKAAGLVRDGRDDDDASGFAQTEVANEPGLRDSAHEGRVHTGSAQDDACFEDTSLLRSSNESKTMTATAMRRRAKGLVSPMLRAMARKSEYIPKVRQVDEVLLPIEANDVERDPAEENREIAVDAHVVKSRSPSGDTEENESVSCKSTEAISNEVDRISIKEHDKTEVSGMKCDEVGHDPVETKGKNDKIVAVSKEDQVQGSSAPSDVLLLPSEQVSHQSLSAISENNDDRGTKKVADSKEGQVQGSPAPSKGLLPSKEVSHQSFSASRESNMARGTMECETCISKSSCFAGVTVPQPPPVRTLRDNIVSPRLDSEPTMDIINGQNTNGAQADSHSTDDEAALKIDIRETTSATSSSSSNELHTSLSKSCTSSSDIVNNSFPPSAETENDALKDSFMACCNDEEELYKFQSKEIAQTKYQSIMQVAPTTVTMESRVLSQEESNGDASGFSSVAPTVVSTVTKCVPPSAAKPTIQYEMGDNTVEDDTEWKIAKRKVHHLFTGPSIPITKAVSDSGTNKLSSQGAEAVMYKLMKPLSWSGHYNDTKISASDEDDDSSYVTHLSGIDEDEPFHLSRCGLSDDVHDTLIWWGERIYKAFGEPGDETKKKMIDIMRSSEEAAYVVRDLSQLKF